MESTFLVFFAFLFAHDAYRHSFSRDQNTKPQQLVVLPVAGFSELAKASRSSQSQADRTRDWVTPPASLLEANDSNPSDYSVELTTDWNSQFESLAEQAQVEVDRRLPKIQDICIHEIVDAANDGICEITITEEKTSIVKKLENALGQLARNIIQQGRELFTKAGELIFFANETTKEPAFERMSKFLQRVADQTQMSYCERACLAMCATKMSMDYTLWPPALLQVKNAPAAEIYQLGIGVCHEYATLAVAFAKKLGITSWVEVGAGGNGNIHEYNLTEHCALVIASSVPGVAVDLESCMLTGEYKRVAALAVAGAIATGGYAAVPLALGTFFSFSADHHYPAFSWEGTTYRADVFRCFVLGETPGCQFWYDAP